MTVYLLVAVNPAGAAYATAVHDVNDKMVLKDDIRVVMLNDRHRKRAVELVRDKDHLTF